MKHLGNLTKEVTIHEKKVVEAYIEILKRYMVDPSLSDIFTEEKEVKEDF